MMKKLSEEELCKLSRIERYRYYDEMDLANWNSKSPEQKDAEILATQEFYANRRGIEGMSLEDEIEVIKNFLLSGSGYKVTDEIANKIALQEERYKFGEKFTYFWETHSPFSQWHRCSFYGTTCLIEGISDAKDRKKSHILQDIFPLDTQCYSSAEQFMMYHKAIIFLDRFAAKQIMETHDTRKIKDIGRKIKNYNEYVWRYYRSRVVYEGNKSKFTQNESLKSELLLTAGTTLVEASPLDEIWGIGLKQNDPRALKRELWKGKNLLGEILTVLRIELKGNY